MIDNSSDFMIRQENHTKSIEAIHDLIIQIKLMTVFNKSHLEMYHFIDDVEYLPQLMMTDEDQTALFEEELEKICKKYNLITIFEKYKK